MCPKPKEKTIGTAGCLKRAPTLMINGDMSRDHPDVLVLENQKFAAGLCNESFPVSGFLNNPKEEDAQKTERLIECIGGNASKLYKTIEDYDAATNIQTKKGLCQARIVVALIVLFCGPSYAISMWNKFTDDIETAKEIYNGNYSTSDSGKANGFVIFNSTADYNATKCMFCTDHYKDCHDTERGLCCVMREQECSDIQWNDIGVQDKPIAEKCELSATNTWHIHRNDADVSAVKLGDQPRPCNAPYCENCWFGDTPEEDIILILTVVGTFFLVIFIFVLGILDKKQKKAHEQIFEPFKQWKEDYGVEVLLQKYKEGKNPLKRKNKDGITVRGQQRAALVFDMSIANNKQTSPTPGNSAAVALAVEQINPLESLEIGQ